jgi:hypothetical protein
MWLLAVLVGAVLLAGGFALGRATDGHDRRGGDDHRSEMPFRGGGGHQGQQGPGGMGQQGQMGRGQQGPGGMGQQGPGSNRR